MKHNVAVQSSVGRIRRNNEDNLIMDRDVLHLLLARENIAADYVNPNGTNTVSDASAQAVFGKNAMIK